MQENFHSFIKMGLGGWQDLCCSTSQATGLLPGYLSIPKGDGGLCISGVAVSQRKFTIDVLSAKNAIIVATFSIREWSGNLERHTCRPGRAGSDRGGIEHEIVATFCQIIQSTYSLSTTQRQM